MMKLSERSRTFIKPFVPTPQTHRHYKLGLIDEVAYFWNVNVVLFFSPISNHYMKFVDGLEKSLEKTLTHLYPLAGRYVDETQVVECNDEGVEFIHAEVNIKFQEILGSGMDPNLVDEFISFNTRAAFKLTDPLLSIQVTKFKCGGVAIGVSATHKIVDASTLCTFVNVWAAVNREENEFEFSEARFNSSSLLPPRGLRTIDLPTISGDMLRKFTRKKFSFSENEISNIRAKAAFASGNIGTRRWSKVQLVMAILSKAFIDLDRAINKYPRESLVMQPMNLRGKMASLIPKHSCGNLLAYCITKSGIFDTTIDLADVISDSVKKAVNDYSKVHHDTEEGKSMVLDSIIEIVKIPKSTHLIAFSSWCKFPFYEANFGFEKPIWVAPGTVALENTAYLMDDAGGNGVEAYVFLKVNDVSIFEESVKTNALFA